VLAVVMVTHDAHLASWADRVVSLKDGAITESALEQTSLEQTDQADEHRCK
jgi:ABC-type lipoprotein export system ATPase subunit